MIEVCGLSKSYGTADVLKNISMTFETDTIVGVVGGNSAGKTTLLRCIARMEPYNAGKILYPPNTTVSYVTEQGSFFPDLNALDNGFLCADLYPGFDMARYKGLLGYFSLPALTLGGKLSRGHKSVLEMCLGLAKPSTCLVVDEPFTGLDFFLKRDFLKLLINELKGNKTIVLASHLLSDLRGILDKAYVLHRGTVLGELDGLEEDYTQAVLRLYETQGVSPQGEIMPV